MSTFIKNHFLSPHFANVLSDLKTMRVICCIHDRDIIIICKSKWLSQTFLQLFLI